MTSPKSRVVGLLAGAMLAAAACGNAVVTPTPTQTPAPTPTPTPTPVVTPSPTPTPTPAPTQLIVATAPVDQLVVAGQLTICSDTARPPQAFLDAQGNPTGSDIDLGKQIASRMGLKPSILATPSAKIVAALTGHTCDIIISGQRISAAVQKQVNMIQYFHAGQAFVVARGNSGGIKTVYDLCGKSVGAVTGTTEAIHLTGTFPYNSAIGLSAICQAARYTAISVKTYAKGSDAISAVVAGKLTAFFTDSPAAGYAVLAQPDQLELVPGLVLEDTVEGISVSKGRNGTYSAVEKALQSMMDDGTYIQILTKYGVDAGALTTTMP